MPEDTTYHACPDLNACDWDEAHWQTLSKGITSDPGVRAQGSTYLLRPEAIESAFILYRVTGDAKYQDSAWRMFKAIMKATETLYGNSAIKNVDHEEKIEKIDSMESFWLAETLKYFYLIFSPPDLINLDEFVFNTEAHPLRRTTP